ncbi:MAG: 30S ribosome-binding factor RbfA [Bacteroidales bacterium]|nr:30S ribosome-binding factor RbfA [Bacteroidales bacterium]
MSTNYYLCKINLIKFIKFTILETYSKRQEKVSKLLQKDLAEILQKESQTFGNVLITVTKVRVSPDLSYAKVFLSLFSPKANLQTVLEGIQQQTSQIRYALGKKIKNQVKKIPEINFLLDDSLDYIDRIDELLK